MEDAAEKAIAEVLEEASRTRSQSPEELFASVYGELRQVARAYMRRERADHTLQATALVHEAYMRLFEGGVIRWENRRHLFCTVARAMRRVLVDHSRKHRALRHGGEMQRVDLEGRDQAGGIDLSEVIAMDGALEKLAKLNPRQAQVVELHSFVGLTEEEVAEILDVSLRTVKNDWRYAKAWLKTAMGSA